MGAYMSELKKSKKEKKSKEDKKSKKSKGKKERSSKVTETENEPVIDASEWKLTDFDRHETLGTGTFGRVFLVKHKESNAFYALKVLRKSLIVRLKQVQHVNNEKEILMIALNAHLPLECLNTLKTKKIYIFCRNMFKEGSSFHICEQQGNSPRKQRSFMLQRLSWH